MTLPAAVSDDAVLRSELLGEFVVPRSELITFPAGLYGFSECRTFALVPTARDGLFWLQSADHSALAFLLADPFVFFADYKVDLSPVELARVGTAEPSDILVLSIVTLGDRTEGTCTANLQGPLVLNMNARTGVQTVLEDEGWGVREPFTVESEAHAAV